MADRKASKSTGETPDQQRKLGKSIFEVIKQNAKSALGPKNTVEKARAARGNKRGRP